MPRIFMSHSSLDNRQAIALRAWLIEQDPPLADEIFLDLHRDFGIQSGQRWKDALRHASSSCEAVICLLSENWEASAECRTEYRFAEYLNKRIFSARVGPLARVDPTREWQRIDLVGDGPTTEVDIGDGGGPVAFLSEGLYRLRQGIVGAGVGAESFAWPPPKDPDRAPYRGWEALEEADAAVFFGRDAQILRGLDAVRGMRTSGVQTMFVVLGPSGTGKSSFLRAGLLPRLRRDDRDFLILDIVRPKRDVLTGDTGFARAIQATRSRVGLRTPSLGVIKQACLSTDVPRVREWLIEAQRAASAQVRNDPDESPLPTLVLPVDQAEELFGADAGIEARQFLDLIAALAGGASDQVGETHPPDGSDRLALIAAVTIRTDRFQALQEAPQLAEVNTVVFDELKPMPRTQFKEVITGPAKRATQSGRPLQIEPELVNKLLNDCTEGADTLPLLALTLARLYADYRRESAVAEETPNLTLADYESMGGIRHVVHTEIDGLLATDHERRATELELLRGAFIPWLATINPDNDQPLRRVARWQDLPEKSRPLVEKLVDARLLIRDDRHGEVVVEVALESLLRQWDELAAWLADEREDLKAADNLERTAHAWEQNHRDDAWLLQGTRLAEAEALAAKPGFADRLRPTLDYLRASRQREDQRTEAEKQYREAELQAAKDRQEAAEKLAAAETAAKEDAQAHAAVLRKRTHILRAVLAATVIVAVIAVVGLGLAINSRHQAQLRTREATAQRVASEALAILNGNHPGSSARAVAEMLAATSLSPETTNDLAVAAALKLSWASKLISAPGRTETVAYSPDGQRIASGGSDNTVRIWNPDTGEQVGQPLAGHTARITRVAFSPDGRRVVSASQDGSVRLWDVASGKQIGAPLIPKDQTADPQTVWSVVFSPDGKRIASAGNDKLVRLWDANTGQASGPPLTGHTDGLFTVAFSPGGDIIASAGRDKTIRLWKADTGDPIGQPLTGQAGWIRAIAFSPDGQRIASTSNDTTVWIWDQVPSGRAAGHALIGHYASGQAVVGHTAAVGAVGFSNTGRSLVSGSDDGTVRWWLVDSGRSIQLPGTRPGDTVQTVAFRPGKPLDLLSCSTAGGIQLWNNIEMAFPLDDHDDEVISVAFSPDGQVIASGSKDKTVRLWRLRDTKTAIIKGEVLRGHTDGIGWLAFSPDGRRIVSAGWDGTIRLWDTATGAPLRVIDSHTRSVGAVAFSPDGRRIVSSNANRALQMWNPDTGEPIGNPMTGHAGVIEIVVFSPDGHLIASGSDDRTIRLWNADTGQQLAQLTGHTAEVYSLAFRPDGHRLVSASFDGTVRIWDVDQHREIGDPLTGHAGRVYAVAYAPNGRHIASGGEDSTIRIWNADDGGAVGAPLSANTFSVNTLAFNADGSRIVSAGLDAELHLWPFPVDVQQTLCNDLAANMSRKQWADWVSPQIGYVKPCPQLPIAPDS